jgi:ABC-type branched-subunit amino acid transport system substrate-binding protein
MKKILDKKFLGVIILIAAVVSLLGACSSNVTTTPQSTSASPNPSRSASTAPASAAPEAPKPEIRIGILAGLTGPGKSAVVPMMDEIENVLKYTNQVEGGIDGAKLSWKIMDNQGTPDGAIIAYKEMRDSFKPTVYFIVEDYLYAGIKDTLTEDKAVMLSSASLQSSLYVPPGRVFGFSVPTADGFAAYSKWVLADWAKNHPEQSRPPKVGVLYWDLPSGLQWKVAEAWVKKQGVELFPVSFPMTSIDLKTQFMQLRDAGVDYIWMQAISQQAALAVRDFSSLGLNGKIPFTFSEMTESQVLTSLAGQGTKGFYQYRSENPYSENSQAAQLWSAIWKWARNEEKWSDNRISITYKVVFTAAVKQAAADAGWQKVDNNSIYEALNKLTSIDTLGNLQSFGYGPQKRLGVSAIKMTQYTGTGTVSVSDPITLPRVFEGIDK